MAEKVPTVNDVNKVFESETVTIEELKQAKETYVKIAKADHKKEEYTDSKFARNILATKFMEWVADNKEYLKNCFTNIWIEGRKYNASISKVDDESGEIENIINIRVSLKQAKTLSQDFNFYIQD